MERYLTFDDVALMPQFSNVASRTEPNLETWLTKDLKIGMPLVPANMDTVIGEELAEVIIKNGGIPIFHRFTDLETQFKWIEKFEGKVFISAGLNDLAEILCLLASEPLGITLDVAHGHNINMLRTIEQIKNASPHTQVIAGNICSTMAYQDMVNAGADAVKVGIGPGAACTTRIITGFGAPQFTTIQKIAEVANKLRVPIIADGGIRNSRDMVLALAAGASSVMIGKLFALTEESAAEKVDVMTPQGLSRKAKYRGQASEDFQNEFYGGLKDKTVAEGVSFMADVTGSAQKLIDTLLGGLRSGLTYAGARNIKELQRKAEFVEVTSSYSVESNPRG